MALHPLKPLVAIDQLESVVGLSTPAFVHRDHRWTLAILRWAQLEGHLPTPCVLVTFDRHTDALRPRHYVKLQSHKPYDLSIDSVIAICNSALSTIDDDWITAGMELGILSDAVILGVQETFHLDDLEEFVDSTGTKHALYFPGLPGGELQFKGELSDVVRDSEVEPLWKLLHWSPPRGESNGFAPTRPKFALDFDLDCFVMAWSHYLLPWLDEVWQKEFFEISDYWSTKGVSGATWLRDLRAAAGLLTISTEPDYCGGDAKASQIFNDLNRHLFASLLRREPLA